MKPRLPGWPAWPALLAAWLGLCLSSCGSSEPASPSAASAAASRSQGLALTQVFSEPAGHDTVETVAFSPDGSHLAVGAADGTVAVYPVQSTNPADAAAAQKLHVGFTSGLAWSPNGAQVASAAADGSVRVWDPRTLQILQTFTASPGSHPAVAWSPEGQRLAVAQGRESVMVVPAGGGPPSDTFAVPGVTRAIVWLLASGELAASDDKSRVLFFRPGSNGPVRTYQPATGHKAVNGLALAPDGSSLAVGYDDGAIILIDPATAKEQLQFPAGRSVGSLAWAPNGQILAETSIAFDVTLWSPKGAKLAHLDIGYDMNGVAWSPDGQYLAAASDDHTVKVWQVTPAQGASTAQVGTAPSFMGR